MIQILFHNFFGISGDNKRMKKEEVTFATKQSIANALKKLMEQKSVDKITVKEILEGANVTRPTFYYHFEDIYDLVRWMFETELLELLKKSENCLTWDEGILLVLEYVEQNRKVCLCAYNSLGREAMQRYFFDSTKTILQRFVDVLLEEIPAKKENVDFIVEFYTVAMTGELAIWLKNPNGRTSKDMVNLIGMVMKENIKNSLLRSAEE